MGSSSLTRDQTLVPCFGVQGLSWWTTRRGGPHALSPLPASLCTGHPCPLPGGPPPMLPAPLPPDPRCLLHPHPHTLSCHKTHTPLFGPYWPLQSQPFFHILLTDTALTWSVVERAACVHVCVLAHAVCPILLDLRPSQWRLPILQHPPKEKPLFPCFFKKTFYLLI